ncbi:MAG: VCBS repeat-containing protein, partial [Gammaproteobacteria bacterium]|nr:VCBS repeat-containing protein [Gammaproteobacteria bacterium]
MPLELQAITAGDVAPYGAPDGRLDAGDLGVMMQFLNGVKQPDSIEKMTVDVAPYRSPDGKLDINDYLLVQKVLLGRMVLDQIIQPLTPLLWANSVAVSPFHISGLASQGSSVNVYLDGNLYTNVTADGNGLFSTQVTLAPGATNTIYVRVIANNIEGPVSETVTVLLPNSPPATLDPSSFTVSYSDKVTVDGIIGSVPVGSTVVVTLVDGSVGQVAAKPDGSFNYSSSGGNTSRVATITVRDGAGLEFEPIHMTTVGTIAGTFDVDPSGAASYSIPIAVPPGTAGMAPVLSLNYSSRGGNGPLGRGWSLGGMSMITRCAKTLARDGMNGRVNLDVNDRFCLDGQHLIAINGDVYGANGSEYRTEIESFTRVVSYGTGNSPDSFKVWTRSGQLIEYGNTTDAQFNPQGGDALQWSMNRIEDRAGNYLTLKYFEDAETGEHYPVEVAYTGNDAAGLIADNRLQLDYEARPDVSSGYVGGRNIVSNRRLSRIQAYDGTLLVREYRLAYGVGPITGVSRLQSVMECDSSVANAVCMQPLRFSWSNGVAGYMSATTSGSTNSGYANAQVLDVNGDGKQDLLVPHSGQWWINYGGTAGLSSAVSSSISTIGGYPDKTLKIDYNSDGLTDLLVPRSGNNWDLLQSGSGSLLRIRDVFKAEGYNNNPDIIDFDGDGRDDLIMMAASQTISYLTYHLHNNSAVGFGAAVDTEVIGMSYQQRVFDYDNDGVSDLLVPVSPGYIACSWFYLHNVNSQARYDVTSDTANCYVTAIGVNTLLGDVNGDGMQDLVSSGSGADFNGPWSMVLNKGTGLGVSPVDTGLSSVNRQYAIQTDYNVDGRMDILYPNGPNWHVYQSAGSGFTDIDTQLLASGYANTRVMDVNGDGLQDIVSAYGGVWNVHLRKGPVPDQLLGITNGMGIKTHITYKPLTDSTVYTKGVQAVFPEQDLIAPLYVVSQTGINDGAGGQYVTDYSYAGARLHRQGRGLLGFREVKSTDPQTGVTTVTTFRQDFPYTGMAESSRRIYNGTVIDETDNSLAAVMDINGHTGVVFPYISRSVQRNYDVPTGSTAGALIKTVQTDTAYDVSQGAHYGNPLAISIITKATSGEIYSKQTINNYASPDIANWVLDRVISTSVRHDGTGQQAITKTSGFSYYPNGLLFEEIIEPNAGANSPLYLRTAYEYDSFGNKTRVSVTGLKGYDGSAGGEERLTETVYDNKGRFPLWTRNSLSHQETYVYDSRFGTRSKLTGPNDLTTSWVYDSFGRKVKEARADGTVTIWSYDFCGNSNCPNGGFIETVNTSGGSPVKTYHDALQRVIRTESVALDGALIYQDTTYDARGNIAGKTRPYFASGGAAQLTTFIYDDLNRPIREDAPDGANVDYIYTGFYRNTHRTHDSGDYDQYDQRMTNVIDQLTQVVDAMGGTKFYSYDASGNLTSVSDTHDPALGTIVTTAAYDLRGRKTGMDDPDMGHWEYKYNAFGELVWQKDAKNQVVTMAYDKLGRMVTRAEPEGSSTWTYDTATNGVGKLASVSYAGSGHSKTLAYDNLGRLSSETSNIDSESFGLSYTYDGFSRRQTVTYPTGFIVRNVYNSHGHLAEVRDATNDTAYWTATASDAEGHITSETLGNGLQTLRGYELTNGSLKTISTGVGTNSNIQYLEYAFDALGNLKERKDNNQTLTETFVYDSLNRLTSAAIASVGTRTYDYDATGNILSKSDFGDHYTYGAGTAGPHAVTEVKNGATSLTTYSYDANGNMISGDGRSIAWTSFNKAATIQKGG